MRRLAITLVAISFAGPAYAQAWGDLAVRFVYDGQPAKPRELIVDKDRNVCGEKPFDESLLVNAKDRGIADVVMWLEPRGSDDPPPDPCRFAAAGEGGGCDRTQLPHSATRPARAHESRSGLQQ
jgi:hypothetical protein